MKVWIGYPPLPSALGVPLLSQNRQFQWFNAPTYVYPVVPTSAATYVRSKGHDVIWCDGIASGMTEEAFLKSVEQDKPDLMAIEAKTPIIKRYWRAINILKELLPETKFVLMGDHVTALPEESFEKCPVDYVLTGGDFDFALGNLVDHLAQGTDLEPGVYFRSGGTVKNSGKFLLKHNLNALPMIDRDLAQWKLYSRENGNFKYHPGTYTMAGRDCWWGKCDFCSWTTTFNNFRSVTPERLLDEVEFLVENYGVKEIFDDSGTFPAGSWLERFCRGMIERGLHKQVVMGCNMIPGVLSQELYDWMGKANFRFVLYGLESANQTTLDRIHKLGRADKLEESMRMAKQAGLEPHVTCMVGYPWESKEEATATIDLTRSLFERGYIDTLQATIVMPYPGTPLFKEADEKGWLRTKDWDRYGMREPILNTEIPDNELLGLVRGIYKSFMTPSYLIRKLVSVRHLSDIGFLLRAGGKFLGHIKDFMGQGAPHNGDSATHETAKATW